MLLRTSTSTLDNTKKVSQDRKMMSVHQHRIPKPYAGNVPSVNKVCFCFPFPFFFPLPPPPPPVPAPSPSPPAPCSPAAGVFDPLPPLSAPHAGAAGALVPKMFRNDWLPLIAAFGRRAVLLVGSSGNADFENTAGPPFVRAPGPGTDVGARTTGAGDGMDAPAPAPEEAHGVVRWGWRKELDEPAAPFDGPWSGGNAFAVGAPARGAGAEPGAGLEAAARATRSQSWREDWAEAARVAVECFALRTRPLVTPAHSEPVAVGTSSGNWLRCCQDERGEATERRWGNGNGNEEMRCRGEERGWGEGGGRQRIVHTLARHHLPRTRMCALPGDLK